MSFVRNSLRGINPNPYPPCIVIFDSRKCIPGREKSHFKNKEQIELGASLFLETANECGPLFDTFLIDNLLVGFMSGAAKNYN